MNMQNNKPNNEIRDPFGEKIRQRLENYEVSAEQDKWDEIKPQLHPARKTILKVWILGIAITAAATSGIFILNKHDFLPKNVPGEKREFVEERKQSNTLNESAILENNTPEGTTGIRQNEISENVPKKTTKIQQNEISKIAKNEEKKTISAISEKPAENHHHKNDSEIYAAQGQKSNNEEKKTTRSIENTNIAEQYTDTELYLKEHQTMAEQKEIENLSKNITNQHFEFLTQDNPNESLKNNKEKKANAKTDSEKKQSAKNKNDNKWYVSTTVTFTEMPDFKEIPLMSVRASVRKDISQRFGVESGIVYSHLRTNSKSMNELLLSTSDFHYLGIPANFIVRILNHPNWDIYFSSGFMLEKGIREINTHYHYEWDEWGKWNEWGKWEEPGMAHQTDTEKETKSIKGVQCSLNASIGATYRLYKGLGLFLEPKCSYYFDGDQPTNRYTERPFMFEITGGLRFGFE